MKTFQEKTEELYTKAAEKLVVLPGVNVTEAEMVGRLLAEAFPLPPLRPPFVTKDQYQRDLRNMEFARSEIRRLVKERLGIVLP